MKYGKKKVDQVTIDGGIVSGYDTSLTTKELYQKIAECFPNVYKDTDGMICGEYHGNKYAIRAKNITYLGHPHPLFKKRIQIADDLRVFYDSAVRKGRTPILLGVYTFEENLVFCDFCIDDYIDKKAHNSSAHVYSTDLADAVTGEYFQKIDYFGNKITAFVPRTVNYFLEELLGSEESEINKVQRAFNEAIGSLTVTEPDEIEIERNKPRDTQKRKEMLLSIKNRIGSFFGELPKQWNGIDCYKEMIQASYRNKYQPEWVGFYLEYVFENYIQNNNLTHMVRYAQDKKDGGIDLDLYFPEIDVYGDLKAHSEKSAAIQGNDWDTVFSILSSKDESKSHIYYIVCEHDTLKDSERGYEVTKFWNRVQNKSDEMSYSSRMKNQVTLKKWMVLDINSENAQFLTVFNQGINSNGKPRKPKIMIDNKNMDKFIIAEGSL